jgi:DNA (cytosine-5)-methyltransferase 1
VYLLGRHKTTQPTAGNIKPPFRLIDLFSGAGGLTLGFSRLSSFERGPAFVPVWANDFDGAATDSYNANFGPHCVQADLVDLLEKFPAAIPRADVVIGGPPCQGFSLLNKNRVGDPRKQLWRPYMEVVRLSGARAFVMENVRQLLVSDELTEIQAVAEEMGFSLASAVLCAADYGVPQERYRAFIVGVRGGSPKATFPPKKTHYSPNRNLAQAAFFDEYTSDAVPWRTVGQAIGDLPKPVGTEIRKENPPLDLHFGRSPTPISEKRYRAVPVGGNRFDLQANALDLTPSCWVRKTSGGTDLFGRLWWDRPSVTIRTEFFKPEKGRYLHPDQHRPITHREAARLQSFPDDFQFRGTKIQIARQIGNAVPPGLAQAVARSIFALLAGDECLQPQVPIRGQVLEYASLL